MKSKFFAVLLIAVILVLCAACDNGAVHSEDLVLKNGTVITPEIRAKLESMRPEADENFTSLHWMRYIVRSMSTMFKVNTLLLKRDSGIVLSII